MFGEEDVLAGEVNEVNFYADAGAQGGFNASLVGHDGGMIEPHSLMISELFPSQTHNTRDMLVGDGVDNTINKNADVDEEEDELQISASQLFFKSSSGGGGPPRGSTINSSRR